MNLDQIKQILANKKILDDKVARADKAIGDIIGELESMAEEFGIPFYLGFSPIAQTYCVEQSEDISKLLEDEDYKYDKEMGCRKYDSICALTNDTNIIKEFAELMELEWENEYGGTGWTHSDVC